VGRRCFDVRIPLARPVFDEEMKSAALDALQSERLSVEDYSRTFF